MKTLTTLTLALLLVLAVPVGAAECCRHDAEWGAPVEVWTAGTQVWCTYEKTEWRFDWGGLHLTKLETWPVAECQPLERPATDSELRLDVQRTPHRP